MWSDPLGVNTPLTLRMVKRMQTKPRKPKKTKTKKKPKKRKRHYGDWFNKFMDWLWGGN